MVKIIKRSSPQWIECAYCKSTLEVEPDEKDVRVENTACFYAGEVEELEIFITCPVCETDLWVTGLISPERRRKLFEEWRKEHGKAKL